MGHYASVWKMKPSNDSATRNKSNCENRGLGETKYLEEVVEDDTEDDEVLGIIAAEDSGKDGHTQCSCIRRVVKCNWIQEPQCLSYLRSCMISKLTSGPHVVLRLSYRLTMVYKFLSVGEVHLPVFYEQQELMLDEILY